MECEMCGRSGRLLKAEVEGTIISVCERCSGLGRKLDVRGEVRNKPKISVETTQINPGFAKRVRDARIASLATVENLGEKIGEKATVIERVERGMRPTDALAKKLEKALGIKLFGAEEAAEYEKKKDLSQSLGDIAVIKVKKK